MCFAGAHDTGEVCVTSANDVGEACITGVNVNGEVMPHRLDITQKLYNTKIISNLASAGDTGSVTLISVHKLATVTSSNAVGSYCCFKFQRLNIPFPPRLYKTTTLNVPDHGGGRRK